MHFHTGSRRPHSERFEPLLTSEGGNIWMQEEEEEEEEVISVHVYTQACAVQAPSVEARKY